MNTNVLDSKVPVALGGGGLAGEASVLEDTDTGDIVVDIRISRATVVEHFKEFSMLGFELRPKIGPQRSHKNA